MARLIPTTNQEDRMGHAGPGAAPLYPKVRFGFTDHPITVWAGVILLRLYFELVGLRTQLTAVLGAFDKRSNNQIPATDVLLCWFYGLALGAARFEHFTRYRRDPLLPRLLGVRRFPSPDTLRRLFGAFTYRTTTEVSETLLRWSLRAMRPILLGHTLDLDSTVFCRYGDQEGSLKGYNPIKPGRPSHHPLLAFLCEARRVLWATVRAGRAGGLGIFRDELLDVVGGPGPALRHCGTAHPNRPAARPPAHSRGDVAARGPRHRRGGSRGDAPRLGGC